jgi:hypothetical protein
MARSRNRSRRNSAGKRRSRKVSRRPRKNNYSKKKYRKRKNYSRKKYRSKNYRSKTRKRKVTQKKLYGGMKKLFGRDVQREAFPAKPPSLEGTVPDKDWEQIVSLFIQEAEGLAQKKEFGAARLMFEKASLVEPVGKNVVESARKEFHLRYPDARAAVTGTENPLEGALPEGALPEGALPEGALPEGALPEGALPEGSAKVEKKKTIDELIKQYPEIETMLGGFFARLRQENDWTSALSPDDQKMVSELSRQLMSKFEMDLLDKYEMNSEGELVVKKGVGLTREGIPRSFDDLKANLVEGLAIIRTISEGERDELAMGAEPEPEQVSDEGDPPDPYSQLITIIQERKRQQPEDQQGYKTKVEGEVGHLLGVTRGILEQLGADESDRRALNIWKKILSLYEAGKEHKEIIPLWKVENDLLMSGAWARQPEPEDFELVPASEAREATAAGGTAGGTAGGRSLAAVLPEGQCAGCQERTATGQLTGFIGLRKPYQFCCAPCEDNPGGFVNHTEECEKRYSALFDPY